MPNSLLSLRKASQNNLKNLDLDLPLGELIVVTGVSGSGKSSLAFDTIYAEGQRRYVETFSPYARQFLDRMDKPRVDRIEGVPPAIAIDQTNPVRTSRSTVGTMTELNDHLKLLFARAAILYCRSCGKPVSADSPESIIDGLNVPENTRLTVTFDVPIPDQFTPDEIEHYLTRQGYTRIARRYTDRLEVVQARLRFRSSERSRLLEELEAAFNQGRGRLSLLADSNEPTELRYSRGLHCAQCEVSYGFPSPNTFSFNSPMGACDTCRGFGRVIGVDYGLVIPDESKSLADGAIKPWQSKAYRSCQRDLLRFALERSIETDKPWRELDEETRNWVIQGAGGKHRRRGASAWYGIAGFFRWLETKAYRMHVRVLLSRYRSYTDCDACGGARLKPDSLLWRIRGTTGECPPVNLFDLVSLSLADCEEYFKRLRLPAPANEAMQALLEEIRNRLRYLNAVGLGYLTLDRQSRTLSGGEVQRINLTTALGTSLVNTLFVLDEPSIGLHARDMQRVIDVLKRLRDAGNSLLVVEHDSQIMLAADRVLDLGPGPGQRGGEIVFFGTPRQLLRTSRSLTGAYLRGSQTIELPVRRFANDAVTKFLTVSGARENNLAEVDVRFPINRLTCLTGVSGSGKSTLLDDILYRGLRKRLGEPTEAPGAHRAIAGFEDFAEVVLIDQAPIGKTTRATPATYVGAFTPIRARFAAEPLSLERGYTAGTFSFNSGDGRCPTCGGNGFEHVEMQFLSDVYLRCEDCDGERFRPEIREVRVTPHRRIEGSAASMAEKPKSISEVLAMTVAEACEFFSGDQQIERLLGPLAQVGLDYLTLGQPTPTLSGGEAQRLKLAGHLAQYARRTRGPRRSASGRPNGKVGAQASITCTSPSSSLFLFDEPTTGLHFDDVATLLDCFGKLLSAGHTLIVIEHQLDVINAADWIVDLGPEGGAAGGRVVAEGTPADVSQNSVSHTGCALAEHRKLHAQTASPRGKRRRPTACDAIEVIGAREHNLQGFDVSIPINGLTVVTGISGSGKSTLAFDIVFAEGQRRYLESLNAYARQFVQPASRAEVDAVLGIPPTVAIEQRTSRGGWKSTVATMTEVYHFVRLLFVKLGQQHCPDCDVPVNAQTLPSIAALINRAYSGQEITLLSPLVVARKGYYTDLARWAHGKGYERLRVNGEWLPTDPWPRLKRYTEHDIELPIGVLAVTRRNDQRLVQMIELGLGIGNGVIQVLAEPQTESPSLYSIRHACPSCQRSFPDLDPRLFSFNSRYGWCAQCRGTGLKTTKDDDISERAENFPACPACDGSRLSEIARAVLLKGQSIRGHVNMTVSEAQEYYSKLTLNPRETAVGQDVLAELCARLRFLEEVGLGYMPLSRAAPSLSGGEAQRIRLAAQLGSTLKGVCYILDEPTIGLHPRDNRKLLETLTSLKNKGNTVVVVEHDEDTIRAADHIIDLGPRAGQDGGKVVATGQLNDVVETPSSLTGRMLLNPPTHPYAAVSSKSTHTEKLEIEGACLHNLRNIDVAIPLNRVVCVTGVSGSGKSTLVRDVLFRTLNADIVDRRSKRKATKLFGCKRLIGAPLVDRVLEVDQTPIGKTPRSCPATYVGIWDYVRRLFAEATEAKIRGFAASRFSFNVKGGRCETCLGQGQEKVEMSFLPDVRIRCERCGGTRFNEETLAVRFGGLTIADVLNLSIDEATDFFSAHPNIRNTLTLLQDVGLGYLTLGQQSPTLSGGEAQRIKLVTELAKAGPTDAATLADPRGTRTRRRTLYLLDEPTIGLHMADVERLVHVLHRLAQAGNSVVVIEHNLDVIAEADWMIDLGPEGGGDGGRIVTEGNPIALARRKYKTHTTTALSEHLGR